MQSLTKEEICNNLIKRCLELEEITTTQKATIVDQERNIIYFEEKLKGKESEKQLALFIQKRDLNDIMENKVKDFETKLKEKEEEKSVLLAKVKEEQEAVQEKFKRKDIEISLITDNYYGKTCQVTLLEEQYKELEEKYQTLEKKLKEKDDQYFALLQKSKDTHEAFREKLTRKEDEVNQLLTEKIIITANYNGKVTNNNELQHVVHTLEASINKKEVDITLFKAECNLRADKISELDNKCKELQNKVHTLGAKLDGYEAEKIIITSNYNEKVKSINELASKLHNLQGELLLLTTNCDAKTKKVTELESKLKEDQKKVQDEQSVKNRTDRVTVVGYSDKEQFFKFHTQSLTFVEFKKMVAQRLRVAECNFHLLSIDGDHDDQIKNGQVFKFVK